MSLITDGILFQPSTTGTRCEKSFSSVLKETLRFRDLPYFEREKIRETNKRGWVQIGGQAYQLKLDKEEISYDVIFHWPKAFRVTSLCKAGEAEIVLVLARAVISTFCGGSGTVFFILFSVFPSYLLW